MPPAIIASIAAIAAAATTTGVSLYEAANQPGQPKLPTAPTPLTSAQNAQTTSAVSQQLPSLQSLTGGSVSPEYGAQFGSTQAGVANNPQASGDIQAAINQFFGLTAPGSSGVTTSPGGSGPSGGNPITDLVARATGGGGGSGAGAGGGDFVSSLLNSDTFKGLAG